MTGRLCECGCGAATRPYTRTNARRSQVRGEYQRFLPGHYSRTAKHRQFMASLDPDRTKHIGPDNGCWKGGRRLDTTGYVLVRRDGREVYEHRLVAAEMLGRPLTEIEVVHHKNGDRSDNRPENLEVLDSQSEHMRIHMTTDEARRRGQKGGWARRAALAAVGAPK